MSVITKNFPSDYPSDIVKLITKMAVDVKNVVMGGSSSVRAIAYPADYDGVDTTKVISEKDFKDVIARLMTTKDVCIGDIKCGVLKEYEVISPSAKIVKGKVVGYNFLDSQTKLETLRDEGMISKAEYDYARPLLKERMTPLELLKAQKEIKFHIVRWKPSEVLKGVVKLRRGDYLLKDGLVSEGMCKVDAIGYVSNNLFKDFSMIYSRGEETKKGNLLNALQSDVLYYSETGEYFKALKRMFSIDRLLKKDKEVERLLPIFNGDLGVLYSLRADCQTLVYLAENAEALPLEKIRYEIDMFKDRISHLYTIKGIVKKENALIEQINRLTSVPSTKLKASLERFIEGIDKLLDTYTKEEMKTLSLLPIPASYLP